MNQFQWINVVTRNVLDELDENNRKEGLRNETIEELLA
jgi:hypothetical protein